MSVPLANLQTTSRVIKRAQYEAFEFTIEAAGIRVRNASHAKPEDHEYVVTITNGLPSECECPADANYDGACKHRVAVAIRKPILDAAIDRQIVADGGEPVSRDEEEPDVTDDPSMTPTSTSIQEAGAPSDDSEDAEANADSCECDGLPKGFPCWDCVRTGRQTL